MVATQVIEVGIDITCNVIHTEIAPINSLLQRIGRCARFENENGEIYVYQADSFKPYIQNISEKTFEELQKINGQNLGYIQGQKIIDAVITEKELLELQKMKASGREDEIKTVWMHPDKARAGELIREIDTINVLLHNNVYKILNPYSYETVSIHKWTLLYNLKKLEEDGDDWLIRAVRESNIIDDNFDVGSFASQVYSYEIISVDEVKRENFIIVNANYISYSEEIGLNFLNEGNEISKPISKTKSEKKIKITKDTYEEHVEYMTKAYNKYFNEQINYSLNTLLTKKLNIAVSFTDLIGILIVMHDFGKLNKGWQDKAVKYQIAKDNYIEGEILAHTDFDAEVDEKKEIPLSCRSRCNSWLVNS